ncbi:MAG: prepilin-type N-terminal cleavage/methylation domain-containing protein [Thermodesulfobacteriota bacterium]|nr:prepilin-type N-terminal cleavage/methylation domain-containing protein [Thermodesulfobacteriota bacterium]
MTDKDIGTMRRDSGLTLVELVVALATMAIVANIAAPRFTDWLQNFRLRSAAMDLYSSMQWAKLGAIRANADWAIIFDNSVIPGRYFVCSDNGGDGWDMPSQMGGTDTLRKQGRLVGYGTGIHYGHGHATTNATAGGGTFPPLDDIGYPSNVLIFDSRGLCRGGFVYLENNRNDVLQSRHTYAVGTRANGNIIIRKWFPPSANWGSPF